MSLLGQTGEVSEPAHRGAGAAAGDARALGRARTDALRARLDRAWRLVASAVAYSVFGCGALALALTVFPLCRLLPGDVGTRDARAQRIVHYTYRFFLRLMSGLGLTSYRLEGFERLRRPGPHLVVANHPSLIDVVILVAQLPQADCVVGESWARSFFLGRAARAAGYVVNSEGAAAIEECVARLRSGRTVVLFPEGTRSPSGGLHPFRRGAAHVALRSGCDLELVTIDCDPPALKKGRPWWEIPERPPHWTATVEEPVRVMDATDRGVPDVLAARRLTAALRARTIEGLSRER